MTARERAQRICPIYKATRNADHFAKCGECHRVEREILAAEREAVEAFLAYLGCHGDDSYSRWMRERFIEWSLREREGAK